MKGWGDYLFYGHSNLDEKTLRGWVLGDLEKFRNWHERETIMTNKALWVTQKNGDLSSIFRGYYWRRIDGFVVAHNVNVS